MLVCADFGSFSSLDGDGLLPSTLLLGTSPFPSPSVAPSRSLEAATRRVPSAHSPEVEPSNRDGRIGLGLVELDPLALRVPGLSAKSSDPEAPDASVERLPGLDLEAADAIGRG